MEEPGGKSGTYDNVDPDDSTVPGIVKVLAIPPFTTPAKIRDLLGRYGSISRLYLQPEDSFQTVSRAIDTGTRRCKRYTHGWVEFSDIEDARATVIALDGRPMSTGMRQEKRGRMACYTWRLQMCEGMTWTDVNKDKAMRNRARDAIIKHDVAEASRMNKKYLELLDLKKKLDGMARKEEKETAAATAVTADATGVPPSGAEHTESRQESLMPREKRKIRKLHESSYKQRRVRVLGSNPVGKGRKPSVLDGLL